MEALFSFLIRNGLLSPGLLLRAEGALAPHELRDSTLLMAPRKRLRRTPAPSPDLARSMLARSVLSCVRAGQSDEDLWTTWRWALREPGGSVWLKDQSLRPELNGALASIAGFDSDVARIRVKLGSGETLLLPGRKLSWTPPDPADVDAVSLLLSKVIDPETAGKVCAQLACTRCERRCEPDTRCVVPHKACKGARVDLVGMDGEFGDRVYYLCVACGDLLWKDEGATAVTGAGNCWEGKHTTVNLVSKDRRVSSWHHTTLFMDCHMQRAIAEIPDSASSLLFSGNFGPFGYLEDHLGGKEAAASKKHMEAKEMAMKISINRSFPNLKLLQFCSHPTTELVVSDELTPELRILSLVAMPYFTACNISSSSLKILRVQLWFGGESVIEVIIEGCKALEEFQATTSAFGELFIKSNSLKFIDLSDAAERLESLSLWTPNLEVLAVRSSQIVELHWVENHPLESDLPPGHVGPALRVRNEKSNVREGWLDHPNVSYFDGPIDVDEIPPAIHRSNLLERFGLEKYGARGKRFGYKNYGGFAVSALVTKTMVELGH